MDPNESNLSAGAHSAEKKKRLVFTNAFVKEPVTRGSFPARPLLPPIPPTEPRLRDE